MSPRASSSRQAASLSLRSIAVRAGEQRQAFEAALEESGLAAAMEQRPALLAALSQFVSAACKQPRLWLLMRPHFRALAARAEAQTNSCRLGTRPVPSTSSRRDCSLRCVLKLFPSDSAQTCPLTLERALGAGSSGECGPERGDAQHPEVHATHALAEQRPRPGALSQRGPAVKLQPPRPPVSAPVKPRPGVRSGSGRRLLRRLEALLLALQRCGEGRQACGGGVGEGSKSDELEQGVAAVGIGRSAELSRMLASEAGLRLSEAGRRLWSARWAEGALLSYADSRALGGASGCEQVAAAARLIVVLDCSSSMQGEAGRLGRALMHALMGWGLERRRQCSALLYSGRYELLRFDVQHRRKASGLKSAAWSSFLDLDFGTGNDERGVLKYLAEWPDDFGRYRGELVGSSLPRPVPQGGARRRSDVVFLSDGEWCGLEAEDLACFEQARARGLRFHGVLLRPGAGASMAALCEGVYQL